MFVSLKHSKIDVCWCETAQKRCSAAPADGEVNVLREMLVLRTSPWPLPVFPISQCSTMKSWLCCKLRTQVPHTKSWHRTTPRITPCASESCPVLIYNNQGSIYFWFCPQVQLFYFFFCFSPEHL